MSTLTFSLASPRLLSFPPVSLSLTAPHSPQLEGPATLRAWPPHPLWRHPWPSAPPPAQRLPCTHMVEMAIKDRHCACDAYGMVGHVMRMVAMQRLLQRCGYPARTWLLRCMGRLKSPLWRHPCTHMVAVMHMVAHVMHTVGMVDRLCTVLVWLCMVGHAMHMVAIIAHQD